MRSSFAIPRVIAVHHLRHHVLWVEFDDGVSGTTDLSGQLLGPVLAPRVLAANGFGARRIDGGAADRLDDSVDVREISRFYGIDITMCYNDHAHGTAQIGPQQGGCRPVRR